MHLYILLLAPALLVAGDSQTSETGWQGCYEKRGVLWPDWQNTHEQNTVTFCRNLCQGFKFAGVMNRISCACGDVIPPPKLAASRCDLPCPGNATQKCGGAGKVMDVFTVEIKPVLVGTPVGCFQNSLIDRELKHGLIVMKTNTPQRCINACRGFKYAGVELGEACFCGNNLPRTPIPETRCNYWCPGDMSKKCGGSLALAMFEISEEPPADYQRRLDLGIYKLFVQRKTWDDAWQQCEDDDAHLIIINSEDEAEFVRSLFAQVPSETRMHAGFDDLMELGTYRTVFSEPLSSTGYSEWSRKYPKVPSPLQHCGSLDVRAQLAQIDGNCAAQAVFVCEKKSDSPDADGGNELDVRGLGGAQEDSRDP